MLDRWKWFKRIGRYWCLLTHEDRDADPTSFLEILIVPSIDDRHADQAVAEVRRRFPLAVVRMLESKPGWWQMLGMLRRWRGEQLSAVVVLSLHPLLVASVCLWFPCYKLLYNRWGEWYLIRCKTLQEWLAGRHGADDRRYDWPPSASRRAWAVRLARILSAILLGARQFLRAVRLVCWILWRLTWLLGRRVAYRGLSLRF